MSTGLIWTPAAPGSPITMLTEALDYMLLALDGIGPVQAVPLASKTPGATGTIAQDVVVAPRVVSAQLAVMGADMPTYLALRAALASAMAQVPVAVGGLIAMGTLVLQRNNGLPDLQIAALPYSAALPFGLNAGFGYGPADLEWYCPYPFWTPTVDTTVNVPTSGTPVNVTNTGDAASSVTYKLGPMTNPVVTNNTTGKAFKINGVIAAGFHLFVKYSGGVSILYVNDSTLVAVNWASKLDHTQKFVTPLSPGVNALKFAATGVTGSMDVIFRPPTRGA